MTDIISKKKKGSIFYILFLVFLYYFFIYDVNQSKFKGVWITNLIEDEEMTNFTLSSGPTFEPFKYIKEGKRDSVTAVRRAIIKKIRNNLKYQKNNDFWLYPPYDDFIGPNEEFPTIRKGSVINPLINWYNVKMTAEDFEVVRDYFRGSHHIFIRADTIEFDNKYCYLKFRDKKYDKKFKYEIDGKTLEFYNLDGSKFSGEREHWGVSVALDNDPYDCGYKFNGDDSFELKYEHPFVSFYQIFQKTY
tara:strand:+ start:2413 stop:3153 length:741 start_codon:yes stop_codon:yes gene_type:complete